MIPLTFLVMVALARVEPPAPTLTRAQLGSWLNVSEPSLSSASRNAALTAVPDSAPPVSTEEQDRGLTGTPQTHLEDLSPSSAERGPDADQRKHLLERAPVVEPVTYQLRYRTADAVMTGVSATAWVLSESVFKAALAPRRCRWCEASVNGLDAWARGARGDLTQQKLAARVSDVIGLAAVPLSLAAFDFALAYQNGTPRAFLVDALILVEVAALSGVLTQLVKFSVGRQRPFVRDAATFDHPEDNNLSFFSGHTSSAVSLVVAAGTVASLRNYRHAKLVWAFGVPLAAFTAYLRIAADKHYLTDVLIGAASGAAFGYLVPTLLHPRVATLERDGWMVQLAPLPNGAALVGTF